MYVCPSRPCIKPGRAAMLAVNLEPPSLRVDVAAENTPDKSCDPPCAQRGLGAAFQVNQIDQNAHL